jgi:hypothetical protein
MLEYNKPVKQKSHKINTMSSFCTITVLTPRLSNVRVMYKLILVFTNIRAFPVLLGSKDSSEKINGCYMHTHLYGILCGGFVNVLLLKSSLLVCKVVKRLRKEIRADGR